VFKPPFPHEHHKRLLGLEYLSTEVRAPQTTLERLGVLNAGVVSHLMALIDKDEGLAQRSIGWLTALYRYCEKRLTGEQAIKKFQSLAVIKLDGGGLAKLADTKVYFPLGRGRRFGFEHELALLHPDLVTKGDGVDAVVSFLSRMGVKKTEPYSLIINHILPKHASGAWKESGIPALVGHVAYIKEHLADYLKGAAAVGESSESAVSRLRTGLYIQSKKVEDETTYFARPFEMYLASEYRPVVPLERLLGPAADPIKFVAGVYLSPLARGAAAEDDETEGRRIWRDFFYQIGVNAYPTVENIHGSGTDHRAGPELAALLSSEDPKIRKLAIELLDRHWAYYSRFLEARSAPRRGYTTTSASQLLRLLRDVRAPSRKRGEFKLGETYQDVDYVRAVFGPSVAYLDADVSNPELLDIVGVTHRIDASACIKRLDQLRTAERVSNKDLKLIYRELERLFDKEETLITSAFIEAPRIYAPTLGAWFRSEEVVWESSGPFIDGQYPPLEGAYREHQTFFCRYLKVSRQPKDSALIQALTKLDEYGQTHLERKTEALKIYKRLARLLREAQARDRGSEPLWLQSLRTEEVFLDHLGRLVDVANDIYIGDDLRLAEAFRAHERISLLDVDPWQMPQLQALLEQCGMRKLSTVANYRMTSAEGAAFDLELTRRIRQRSNRLMQLIYARAHGAFERAGKQGLWTALGSLEVRTVAVLDVEAEVSGCTVRVATDAYRQENLIYLQAGTRGKYDKLAQELCLYLGAKPDDLSESVYRVLTAAGEDELRDFFEVKGIPDIPQDELVNLLKTEEQSRQPELEPARAHPGEDSQSVPSDVSSDGTAEVPVSGAMPPVKTITSDSGPALQPPVRRVAGPSTADTAGSTGSQSTPSSPPASRRREPDQRPSSRLLSYAEPASRPERDPANETSHEERLSIAKAAVDFVIELERQERHEVVEMPFTNEGFDIRRESEGVEEYIEVKGLSGAWGAEGIVLTPPELRMAERQRERFWLYVVEYATEPSQRRLYKIQDPFGKTDQFRFDSGWKSVIARAAEVMEPAPGRRISIEGLGAGTILTVTGGGLLRRLSIRLDSGEEVTRTFDPARMSVSKRL
jgi:hypothetical protein